MGPWAWIVAYVVAFALVQLLLYRYLGRDGLGTDAAVPTATEPAGSRSGGTRTLAGDAVACANCGAENSQAAAYRFCHECTSPLR